MTVQELSQLYYLNILISKNEERLEELRDQLTSTTSKLTGMPGKPGASDNIGDTVPEIVDLMRRIEAEKAAQVKEKAKLENYLISIEDAQTKLSFTLRFVELKSWAEVAAEIGGNNTEESVKKTCYRYLKQNNE